MCSLTSVWCFPCALRRLVSGFPERTVSTHPHHHAVAAPQIPKHRLVSSHIGRAIRTRPGLTVHVPGGYKWIPCRIRAPRPGPKKEKGAFQPPLSYLLFRTAAPARGTSPNASASSEEGSGTTFSQRIASVWPVAMLVAYPTTQTLPPDA